MEKLAPRKRIYIGLLLMFCGSLSTSLATAKPQTTTRQHFEQDNKLCMEPETPMQCRDALPACKRVASALERQPASPEHDAAQDKVVSKLAGCEDKLGQYAGAERHYRQSLDIRQRMHGPEHVDVATILGNLGSVLNHQGKYREAETLCRQALGMHQKLLGADHSEVAKSLNSLANVLTHQGRYGEAETLYRQALEMRQKLLGAEHPEVAKSLNNLAMVLHLQGKYGEAAPLLRQALKMTQKLFGAEHTGVISSLSNLGAVLFQQGKYGEAETLFRQALGMSQKLLGAEHPLVASRFADLANVMDKQGKHREAEALYRQALRMGQKLLGAEHPDVAKSFSGLAILLGGQGRYGEAETLHRKVLGMRQKLLGAEHPDVAKSLNGLATLLEQQGKYGEAEALYRRALAMQQKLLGTEHPDLASTLTYLALVLSSQGKYGEAEMLHRRALAMEQKLLGAEHPKVAWSLDNLATVLSSQGRYDKAEALYRQALEMRQKLFGAQHPGIGDSLDNLSSLLLVRGQLAQAITLLDQAGRIREGQFRATVSETRMQALLASLRWEEDTIYGALLSAPVDSALRQLALTTTLLRKGRAAEAGTNANRLLHRNLTEPAVRERFSQWRDVLQQREVLLYSGPAALQPFEYRARLKDLQLEAESLEAQLSAALPEIKQLQPPGFDDILPAVAKRLPKSGALVEVVWAHLYQEQATGTQTHWGSPHYIALLLFPDQRVLSTDLGEAAEMDSRMHSLLVALRSQQTDPTAAAYALYQQALAPILPHLAGVSELFLSLDGTLNLVPFDALHDGHDYLLGRYRFHYLTSGRDLLREVSMQNPGPALLLANPDFGPTGSIGSSAVRPSLYQRLAGLSRLPGTKQEAEIVAPLLEVVPLLEGRAREEAVRAVRSPFVLHIATHGLFFSDVDLPPPSESDRGLGSFSFTREIRTKNVSTPEAEMLPGEAGAMNRSALVLAGVAQGGQAPSPDKDGLLTAEEARSLDLDGTQLVVLSACETGQGALSAGQGVYGLRRAFLVAGAETLVTSLWRIHDEATGELMGMYYRRLLDKKKPGDRLGAMQEAMQELRARPGRSHPYYWAPFLVIGQDGPLRPPTLSTHRAQ